MLHGGGQERGLRSETENVADAVGVALAIRLAENDRFVAASTVTARRDRFIAQVFSLMPSAVLTGHPEHRVFPGMPLLFQRIGLCCRKRRSIARLIGYWPFG